jgi:hypothetical protein
LPQRTCRKIKKQKAKRNHGFHELRGFCFSHKRHKKHKGIPAILVFSANSAFKASFVANFRLRADFIGAAAEKTPGRCADEWSIVVDIWYMVFSR